MSENTSLNLFNTPQSPIFFLQHLLCFVSLFNLQSFPRNRVFVMLESAKFLTALNTLKKLQGKILFFDPKRIERENWEPLTCVFDL